MPNNHAHIRHFAYGDISTHLNSSEVLGYLRETESMLQLHDAFSASTPTYRQTSLGQHCTPIFTE